MWVVVQVVFAARSLLYHAMVSALYDALTMSISPSLSKSADQPIPHSLLLLTKVGVLSKEGSDKQQQALVEQKNDAQTNWPVEKWRKRFLV